MNRTISCLLATAFIAAPLTARAGNDMEEFAEDVKDASGAYHDSYIIEKLTNFKLGAKCWKKMHNKDENGIHTATFYVAYVREYAKRVTSDDWASIETQGNNDREKNKSLVEKMVKDFAPKFSFTMTNEGDDCDTTMGSLMLRYWGTVGDALQYLSGKKPVKITLNVTSKTKDVDVKISGGNITITASRDIEPAEWDTKITKAFKRSKL